MSHSKAAFGFSKKTHQSFESEEFKHSFTILFVVRSVKEHVSFAEANLSSDFKFKIYDSKIEISSSNDLLKLKHENIPALKMIHFNTFVNNIWVSVGARDVHNLENNFIKFGFGQISEQNLVAHFIPTSSQAFKSLRKINRKKIALTGILCEEKIGFVKQQFNSTVRQVNCVSKTDLKTNKIVACDEISIPENLFKAIEYSIETEGCSLNNKFKEKINSVGKFAANPNAVYIRVPFGVNFGNEPSQPIVLEIWPKEDLCNRQLDYQFEELKKIVLEEYELRSAPFLNGKYKLLEKMEGSFFNNEFRVKLISQREKL